MKTIIVGAGFTGVLLARKLVKDGHKVVLVDSDPERVREIGGQLDCAVMCSEGNSLEALENAGIASADALVTVTPSDEINMITCTLADAVHPKLLKIARVRNYSYFMDTVSAARKYADVVSGERRTPFGIDWIVNPEVEAAAAIGRAIAYGAVGEVIELGSGYGIASLPIGRHSPLNGKSLSQLQAVDGWHHLVAYVETQDGPVLPSGSSVLVKGNRIGVLTRLSEIQALAKLCDAPGGTSERMAVVGAGRVGSLVVMGRKPDMRNPDLDKTLGFGWKAGGKDEIVVIDEDLDRCRAMVRQFAGIRVVCGNATDDNIIREERLDRFDLVVAASENPERNLVTAAHLKSKGATKTIALTSGSSISGLAEKMDVDISIPIRDTVVDNIIGHLRGSAVKSVHTLCRGRLELVECVAEKGSGADGRTLGELGIAGRATVLFVRHPDGKSAIPNGDTAICAGDKVVLIKPAGNPDALGLFGAE